MQKKKIDAQQLLKQILCIDVTWIKNCRETFIKHASNDVCIPILLYIYSVVIVADLLCIVIFFSQTPIANTLRHYGYVCMTDQSVVLISSTRYVHV